MSKKYEASGIMVEAKHHKFTFTYWKNHLVSFNVLATKQIEKRMTQMVSANTLCKNVLNVKNTVIKNCNLYSDKNGVKHIRIQARPNKWHENDCPFCHKSCPVYDKHSSRPTIWRGLDLIYETIIRSYRGHSIYISIVIRAMWS